MDPHSARTACSFAGSDRVVIDIADRLPKPQPAEPLKPIAQRVRLDPDESRAFAAKVELGASVIEALENEAKCLRVPMPEDALSRLVRVEAELHLLAEDIRKAGGVS